MRRGLCTLAAGLALTALCVCGSAAAQVTEIEGPGGGTLMGWENRDGSITIGYDGPVITGCQEFFRWVFEGGEVVDSDYWVYCDE